MSPPQRKTCFGDLFARKDPAVLDKQILVHLSAKTAARQAHCRHTLPKLTGVLAFSFRQCRRASSISTLPSICRHTLPKLTGVLAFSFRQCRRASSISTLPAVALPSHSPEADRCSRVFLQTMPTGFFHKHSSGRRIAVTSLPRPPEIPCFFFPQSCRAFSMTAFPAGTLPSHSPEADRCSRVFLQTMPTGFFHKHSSGRRIAVTLSRS